MIVGLHNGGDDTYNVSAIYGSLNAAHDYRLFFQNFSGMVSRLRCCKVTLLTTLRRYP